MQPDITQRNSPTTLSNGVLGSYSKNKVALNSNSNNIQEMNIRNFRNQLKGK